MSNALNHTLSLIVIIFALANMPVEIVWISKIDSALHILLSNTSLHDASIGLKLIIILCDCKMIIILFIRLMFRQKSNFISNNSNMNWWHCWTWNNLICDYWLSLCFVFVFRYKIKETMRSCYSSFIRDNDQIEIEENLFHLHNMEMNV